MVKDLIQKSNVTLQSRGHLTNEERFISTSTTPMATKRDREVDPDEEMLSHVGRQKIKIACILFQVHVTLKKRYI